MNLADDCHALLPSGLESLVRIRRVGADCLVSTTNIYPSGRIVGVSITPTADGFRLSDCAKALEEIRSAGIDMKRPGDYISPAAKRRGVKYSSGEIYALDDGSNIALLIKLIANASSDAVVTAIESHKLPKLRSFKCAFNDYMRETFGDRFKPELVAGDICNYRMDYVYRENQIVIADPVNSDTLSIDRAFRAHYDIGRSKTENFTQVIVFDSGDPWKMGDLSLLKTTGANVIPYQEVNHLLREIVCQAH